MASPRRRALETARALGLVPGADERLAQIDFGTVEGSTYDEVRAANPDLYERWMRAPTTVRFPGGESYADVKWRAAAAVRDVRLRPAGPTDAVVAHGGVIRAVLADAPGLADARIFRLAVGYLGLGLVTWYGDEPVVEFVNRRPTA